MTIDIPKLVDQAFDATDLFAGVAPLQEALEKFTDPAELAEAQQTVISYMFAKVYDHRLRGAILFESDAGPGAAAATPEIAHAGVLLALRVAAASDDMGKISEHLAAVSIERGPAFGAVTAVALQYMSAQILQQIYAETPTLKRFLAPAIEDAVRTAEESGDGR